MSVKERLKQFIKAEKITIIAFEQSINVANGYVNSISKGIGNDKINVILEVYPNLNIEWLLSGIGEMYRHFNDSSNNSTISNVINEPNEVYHSANGNKFTSLRNGKFKIMVKKVPVKAFGSYPTDFQNVDFIEELEDVFFTVDTIPNGRYLCFEVQGDSMNGGSLDDTPDSAELLCIEYNRDHWKDGFKDSKYGWVIVHVKTVLFKDIKSLDVTTGDIVCGSRSGLPNHPDFTINLDDVKQIFKVLKRTF